MTMGEQLRGGTDQLGDASVGQDMESVIKARALKSSLSSPFKHWVTTYMGLCNNAGVMNNLAMVKGF